MFKLVNLFFTLFLFYSLGVFASSVSIDPQPLQIVDGIELDLASSLERAAINQIKTGNSQEAVIAIESYILETGDFSILENSTYESLRLVPAFIELKEKYLVRFTISTFFYLYVGLIGIFIALILNVRRKRDAIASGLIGFFVFMHSVFLIHVALYLSNYVYYEPHTLSMSAPFSFLYGPILYFYFKRITQQYTFKKKDLLHLIPTGVFVILLIPVFTLSADSKLAVMLGQGSYSTLPYLVPATILKVLSLGLYGIFTVRLYLKDKKTINQKSQYYRLQRAIVVTHSVYAMVYGLYAFIIVQYSFGSGLLHVQLLAMTGLVLYIGYIAYAHPLVLEGRLKKIKTTVAKYQNSGLTPSFSTELKEQLLVLLEQEKVYRESSIKLEYLAQRLNTTRHNASQVINEHFGLNFFELINKYRIEEAMERLKNNPDNLNIIDIAYGVGYNNKVTFNKSFKRFSNLTPSQFLKLDCIIPT